MFNLSDNGVTCLFVCAPVVEIFSRFGRLLSRCMDSMVCDDAVTYHSQRSAARNHHPGNIGMVMNSPVHRCSRMLSLNNSDLLNLPASLPFTLPSMIRIIGFDWAY